MEQYFGGHAATKDAQPPNLRAVFDHNGPQAVCGGDICRGVTGATSSQDRNIIVVAGSFLFLGC
jgi:hypothetical protein